MSTEIRSGCPIANTLDIVGDRWSLLILRDMFNGKKTFSEFLNSPEKITTSVLTVRLNQLSATGLVQKELYQSNPKRYQYLLTDQGRDMLPVLQEMCRWANKHMPETWVAPEKFMEKRT
ncbi:putative HTH-type transcriptional regulator YybR [Pseudovibrio axinellae]|uniref:Putative HTH-type transcriptional regulator YybR n=1 Tax=Pseudovibrio axinellae TaxID=989403 RepID=A0A166BC20_9HYPH|nr:helix-turn-helix domain-containing protein [Pseudovibrio axinellae]KZL22112.1 putative HTH-type transcriptional regulator YybR [Pseudovibrio axinellae]SEQ54799.1 transcriptional regulator, HxlR family [Pseudovibrio axinellae]